MKKTLILIALGMALGSYFYFTSNMGTNSPANEASKPPTSSSANNTSENNAGTIPNADGSTTNPELAQEDLEYSDKLASEIYKTSQEALDSVKKAALTYDDNVLQQFMNLGDCSWCDSLYTSVKDLMNDTSLPNDQRSFYAELLATSGKIENVKSIIAALETAKTTEEKELFAESLELALGGDDLVKTLADYMKSSDDTIKESSIAAVSNQGTRLAAEMLYKNAVESNNPDGYYSLGIGLGEMVPHEDVYPYLQEQLAKKDDYSNLAVKALLNAGLPGLQIVFDALAGSKDSALDEKILKDAADHIVFDEETKQYLTAMAEKSPNAVLKRLAQEKLKEFESEEQADEQDSEIDPGDEEDA